jgi:hypothetical protein
MLMQAVKRYPSFLCIIPGVSELIGICTLSADYGAVGALCPSFWKWTHLTLGCVQSSQPEYV